MGTSHQTHLCAFADLVPFKCAPTFLTWLTPLLALATRGNQPRQVIFLSSHQLREAFPDPRCMYVCVYVCMYVCICFLGPHPWHMEVPRLGVQSELQLLAYTTTTATSDVSRVCDLHHSSWQCQILSPLSEARDRTSNLMVPSGIRFCCTTRGTPSP